MATGPNEVVSQLLRALDQGVIEVHYQPQMFANGERIASVEALVRWPRSDGTLAPPANFIPALNRNAEVLDRLGFYVLERACRDVAQWPGLSVGVNIAPQQFVSPDFVVRVRDTVLRAGVEPARVELEILETSWFDDADAAIDILRQLRSFGLRIAMDDFGTGYASLSALLNLPLDKLKIDRSFVLNCHEIKSAAIIHAIVSLARAVGLQVTAEGVETREQARFLRVAGCHFLQGHLYSPAAPASAIGEMLTDARHVARL